MKQRRTIRAPVARNPSCFKIRDSNHEDHYLYFHPVGCCADVRPCRVSAISCPVSAKRKADRSNKHGYETSSGHSCGSRARRYGICPGPVRKISRNKGAAVAWCCSSATFATTQRITTCDGCASPAPSHGDAPLSPNGASHFDRANGCEAPQGRGLNS